MYEHSRTSAVENFERSMKSQVAMVTGANAGLGKVTALALARLGASVICICRNQARGQEAVTDIVSQSGNSSVELMLCDLSSQKSVRSLAEHFKRAHPRLHILVNNAGVAIPERRVTVDGLENTFALNHLGSFLLTQLLLDVIKRSAPARIVNISSGAQRMGTLNFDDLQMEKKYSAFGAYCRSKLANIMFTYDLADRLEGTGVTVNAIDPGPSATRFAEEFRGPFGLLMKLYRPFMRTPEKGAETAIYLASSQQVEGKTGLYWADKKPIKSNAISYHEATRQRLWHISEQLTGISSEPDSRKKPSRGVPGMSKGLSTASR